MKEQGRWDVVEERERRVWRVGVARDGEGAGRPGFEGVNGGGEEGLGVW